MFSFNVLIFLKFIAYERTLLIFTLDKSTVEITIGNWFQTFLRHWKSFIKQSFVNWLNWPPVSAVQSVSSIPVWLRSGLGRVEFRKSNHFLYRLHWVLIHSGNRENHWIELNFTKNAKFHVFTEEKGKTDNLDIK